METTAAKPAPSETLDAADPEAIDHDDRLILWMLELNPAQRLEALQSFVEGVTALRNARKVVD